MDASCTITDFIPNRVKRHRSSRRVNRNVDVVPPEDKLDEINGNDRRIVGLWNLAKMKLFLDSRGQPLSCI